MQEKVILVNAQDKKMGEAEKIEAHKKGLLHRAFSIFIGRNEKEKTELLLQKRSRDKYHSGGLWTNTCCGHPRPDENIHDAAQRRLKEEMGFCVDLKEISCFHYSAYFKNGLIENEIDHIFVGLVNNQIVEFNSAEIEEINWMSWDDLEKDLVNYPERYSAWLPKALTLIKRKRGVFFA